MIQVKLAKHKGYCFGVKRAIEMVEKALEEGPYPIWTLGPIIHNPVVVAELTKKGVRIAGNISQVDSGTLILRTHGTTLEERQNIPRQSTLSTQLAHLWPELKRKPAGMQRKARRSSLWATRITRKYGAFYPTQGLMPSA